MYPQLVQRFSSELDGFNQRSLTYSDFQQECERRGIRVKEKHLRRVHGASLRIADTSYIYVNACLDGSERTLAGYHELTHNLYHAHDLGPLLSVGRFWNVGKSEKQANAVAVIALMPDNSIWGLNAESIAQVFRIPLKVAEFRRSLLMEW